MLIRLKILICILVNLFIVRALFIDYVYKFTKVSAIVRQVYPKEGYKYWSILEGQDFCRKKTVGEEAKVFRKLDIYADKKTNVIYLTGVGILDCIENIQTLGYEFHRRNLQIALNIEKDFNIQDVYKDFVQINPSYYKYKFDSARIVNDWIDYLVFDNAMDYLTYGERRQIQIQMREVFPKLFIGYRFPKKLDLDKDAIHPNRKDKLVKDFLPGDDDGDFIITSQKVSNFKRTKVFIEDENMDKIGVDGEFIM